MPNDKIIDFHQKRRQRRFAQSAERIKLCHAMRDRIYVVVADYIVNGGPSDEAIAGMLARVFVQFCKVANIDDESTKRILSEEML